MSENHVPFWKIPAMWLVIVLPALAIIGGIAMIVVASRSGGNDGVADRVQRTAQIQTADLGPDAVARERGLTAIVRSQDGIVEVIPVTGEFDRKAPLRVDVRHPTRQADDLTLTLAPTGTGWRAEEALSDAHDWTIEARDATGAWRIVGRLPRGEYATRLDPALEAAAP